MGSGVLGVGPLLCKDRYERCHKIHICQGKAAPGTGSKRPLFCHYSLQLFHSVDFEIESSIDLQLNIDLSKYAAIPKLFCNMIEFPPHSGLWVAGTVQVLLGYVREQLRLCCQELGQLAGIQRKKGAW